MHLVLSWCHHVKDRVKRHRVKDLLEVQEMIRIFAQRVFASEGGGKGREVFPI